MKIERREYDVYCFIPDLGAHYSLHESGEAHFQPESSVKRLKSIPPIALVMGQAGKPIDGIDGGVMCNSLKELGSAECNCVAIVPIEILDYGFRNFRRNQVECFEIDKALLSEANGIEVGVWGVPDRNKISFSFNNPDIQPDLLDKIEVWEPQIWVFAKPF